VYIPLAGSMKVGILLLGFMLHAIDHDGTAISGKQKDKHYLISNISLFLY
jgi:hypothetical protein